MVAAMSPTRKMMGGASILESLVMMLGMKISINIVLGPQWG